MNYLKAPALALAAIGMTATAAPAAAVDFGSVGQSAAVPMEDSWQNSRWDRGRDRYYGDSRYDRRDDRRYNDRRYNDRRYDDRRYNDRRYNASRYDDRRYNERRHNGTRVWQDRNGRYYCERKDGTTGMIIGGALGALLGREVDGGRDRTLGTILGAAGGAILGKEVAKGDNCR